MNYSQYLGEDVAPIFLFHGVIERAVNPVRNYTRKHLEKDYFANLIRGLLEAGGRPISLDEWIVHHEEHKLLPPKSFAITFDDGFRNNLTVAAPVLEDFRVPSTFYLTSDFVQNNRMSWIDRIEYVLEPAKPGKLILPWGERSFADDVSKRTLLDEIRLKAKSDPAFDLDGLATDIQMQLGHEPIWSSSDQLDQKLSWNEVAALASNALFRVGGHSHTHQILAFLDDERLEHEIATSCDLLEQQAGVSPRHYSYPEGLAHCYSDRVIARLRAHGVVCCPTAEPGQNDHRTDLFRLKRILVT